MEKSLIKKIIEIEKCMNQMMARSHNISSQEQCKVKEFAEHSEEEISDLINTMNDNEDFRERKVLSFVNERLRQRGYICENKDKIDYARFYTEADIGQSVWSRFMNGQNNRTRHKNLLKIVLGLRLNEEDTRYFLSLAGSGFSVNNDKLDQLIVCYIKSDYLGDVKTEDIVHTVSSILRFYAKEEKDGSLKKNLNEFYDL